MKRHGSKASVTSVTSSCRATEKKSLPTHMIIQRENDNEMILLPVTHLVNSSVTRIKLNNTATFKVDLNSRKQERGRILQLGEYLICCYIYFFYFYFWLIGDKEECVEQLQVFEMTAEIGEQSSNVDENDEVNVFEEDQTIDKQEKNKTISTTSKHQDYHTL